MNDQIANMDSRLTESQEKYKRLKKKYNKLE